MIYIEKKAGTIFDHQDDPEGAFWNESLKDFWPDEFAYPEIGIDKQAGIVDIHDGFDHFDRYPVDTPEDTLLSSMYFETLGKHNFDEEEQIKIASMLSDYRLIHNVELSDDFIDFANGAQSAPEEVYADMADCLPVTSAEQLQKSAALFARKSDAWSPAEQIAIGFNLKQASLYHDVDVDVPYDGRMEIELDTLEPNIEMRIKVAQDAGFRKEASQAANPVFNIDPEYVQLLQEIDVNEPAYKVAQQLFDLDTEYGMDQFWGSEYDDPVTATLHREEIVKVAYDMTKLEGHFNQELIDAISEDPETIIPTLPMHQRTMVEDLLS